MTSNMVRNWEDYTLNIVHVSVLQLRLLMRQSISICRVFELRGPVETLENTTQSRLD